MVEVVHLFYGPLVDRATAKAKGVKRFFTGRPCKRGHIEQRLTSTGACMACNRLAVRKAKGVIGPPCGSRVTIRHELDRQAAQLPIPFTYSTD